MSIQDKIREYIEEFVLYGGSLESDDDSLVESDMIDSTGVMDLVSFIEKTFDVEIPAEALDPEYLDTVNRLANLVESIRNDVANVA